MSASRIAITPVLSWGLDRFGKTVLCKVTYANGSSRAFLRTDQLTLMVEQYDSTNAKIASATFSNEHFPDLRRYMRREN